MLATETLGGGFSHSVFEAQAVFRAVMAGFAHPGKTATIETDVAPPKPFGKAAASILLTLCDFETATWLSPTLRNDIVSGWVNFHSGAPLKGEPHMSTFAFVATVAECPTLALFSLGTDEYPDTSTTIVLEITALTGGSTLVLEGPGVKGTNAIAPSGLPSNFIQMWAANGALFPCGVDLILTSGDCFLCLPRTTRIKEA